MTGPPPHLSAAKRFLFEPRVLPHDHARAWADALAPDTQPDLYGQGTIIEEFEAEVATLLGKPAALFLPSGIMAQQIALRLWSERTGRHIVGYHPHSHLASKEHRALDVLHDLRTWPIGPPSRTLTVEDLQEVPEPLAALVLELPQRDLGGEMPTWDDLQVQLAWARAHDTPVHLDGARLWESGPFYARPYAEICEGFSSVYVSFYKGLGAVAGAVLAGDAELISAARVWQKRLGGNLIHLWPLVVSARLGLTERLDQMAAFTERARRVAAVFRDKAGVRVRPDPPIAPMMHVFVDAAAERLQAAVEAVTEHTGIALFSRCRSSEVPGWSMFELAIGPAASAIEDEELSSTIDQLLAHARAPQEGTASTADS